MTLIERLLELSRLWCAAHDRSLSRLATIVANDGKVLSRLEDGRTCTVAMFERFLVFFRDPQSWPDAAIPERAAAALEGLEQIAITAAAELMADGNSTDDIGGSPDNGGDLIGAEARAA